MIVSKGEIIISSLSSIGILNQQLKFHRYPGENILKLIESERDTYFAVVGNINVVLWNLIMMAISYELLRHWAVILLT